MLHMLQYDPPCHNHLLQLFGRRACALGSRGMELALLGSGRGKRRAMAAAAQAVHVRHAGASSGGGVGGKRMWHGRPNRGTKWGGAIF